MAEKPTLREEIDELAAFAAGAVQVSTCIASALIEAGAVERSAVLRHLEAYSELMKSKSMDDMAAPLDSAINILESGGGPLSDSAYAEILAAAELRMRRRHPGPDEDPD